MYYVKSVDELIKILKEKGYDYFLSLLRSKSILDRLAALGGLEIAGFVFDEKVIYEILCKGVKNGDRTEA